MLSFLKSRAFWTAVGLILAAALILLFGPLLAFGTWRPFDTLLGRGIGIAGLAVFYGLWTVVQNARANQAGKKLASAVVKQSETEGRPSADVVQLRERFEEAVAALKQKKHGGHSLYDLPWYVIIGAPGSGKTTALVNSGLHFPLDQRSGKGALRGVGGTRNCDWWFTEEAIFLDTAGRYTTQDSDAGADSAGWAEFLAQLKKYRKRRPVNGIILAISAHDLMVQGQAGREAHVAAARRRLNELNKELRINLPVYVLVTKCDLVAGFTEYFDDVAQDARTQVWGVTFPVELTQQAAAAAAFPAEFDGLIQRLNERLFARLEDDHDVRRRAKVFGFPQQMAALREHLSEFVSDVFESTRFDQRVLLRGVYFTSGTQEGTPIDRLLGALSRRFSVPAASMAPPGSRGKAYFIERLLKDVMIAESGLAGLNRRVEIQKAAAQLSLYAAIVLVAAMGLLALWHSYSTNRTHVAEFATYATNLATTLPPGGESAVNALPRLDQIKELVARAQKFQDVSWVRRGWGLDHSGWIVESAKDVDKRELSDALLDATKTQLEQRLKSLLAARDSVKLYQHLRTYLMLADPRQFDPVQVKTVLDAMWAGVHSGDPKVSARLSEHFGRLLGYELPGFKRDDELVRLVRDAIPPDAVPDLLYSLVKLEFQKKELPPPVESFFSGPAPVFRRPAGAPLLSGMFSKAGFNAMAQAIADVDSRFEKEIWVWGPSRPNPPPADVRKQRVWEKYEREYIEVWDKMLAAVIVVSPTSREAVIEMVQAVAGTRAVLKQFLGAVDTNTFLLSSLTAPKSESFLSSFGSSLAGALQAWDREVREWYQAHEDEPGAKVTEHFSAIHVLLLEVGGAAPIDKLLVKVKDLGTKLETTGSNTVGTDASLAAVAGLSKASLELRRDAADLKGPAAAIGALLADIGNSAERVSTGDSARGIYQKFEVIARQCHQAIDGRYPFHPAAREEVTLDDFGRLFGASGAFETFVRTDLAQVAEVVGSSINWKTLPGGADPSGLPRASKQQLELALKIRDRFFGGGNQLRVGYEISIEALGPKEPPKVRRVDLMVDGKTVGWSYGPLARLSGTWPGMTPSVAAVTFTEFSGATPSIATESSQWSLFRLIDRGTLDPLTDNSYRLRFEKDGNFVVMILVAGSVINNPFGARQLLSGFNCGG